MASYVKSTDFASKDALLSGDPGKIIKGTEIDTEFNAIAVAVSTKSDSVSPTFTGTPLAPTASPGTNNTQIATTAFATAADTAAILAERSSTVTLTNKTLTNPTITGGTITGITDLTVADGGTGVSSLTADNVILGDGTNPVKFVAPGSSGNVLTSNGTTWQSVASVKGVGDGQTWQSVTRNIGTTYTNSTGRPIMLIGRAIRAGIDQTGLSVEFATVTVPLCYSVNSNGGQEAIGSIVIPTGATYKIVNSNPSYPVTSSSFWELR
jgi:hypothetical protein